MFRREHWRYVLAATALMTLQPLITTASKVDGRYAYLQVSTTFLSELLKLSLSLLGYFRLPYDARSFSSLRPAEVMRFAVPAVIYFVNNNLLFVILAYVNSTTYQILSSLKTVFTGLLFRVVLKRRLTDLQVVAILLLACGTATSQLGASTCERSWGTQPSSSAHGVVCTILTCALSALGGVYSERLMKDDSAHHSIHLQNTLLYFWGLAFNGLALLGKDLSSIRLGGFFQGYTIVVWSLVVNNAFNGLAISAILKYTDNIVRVFAHAAAMLLTMVMEVACFDASPTPQLLISAMVVSCSIYLYNRTSPVFSAPISPPEPDDAEQQLLQREKPFLPSRR